MTAEEFLDFQDRSEGFHEYYHGEVFEMEDTTFTHEQIIANLGQAAMNALRPKGCRVLFARATVATDPKGHYTHPDIVIVCGQPEFTSVKRRALSNPKVIIEALSPSTQDYDRGTKFKLYRKIASLPEYLNVQQDQPAIERHIKQPDGSWVTRDLSGLDATLRFESVPLEVPFPMIYDGVDFVAG